MVFFIIFLIILLLLLVYHLLTKKYLNPYKLTMVFGKKGSGKSTLMVKVANQYLSRGWSVYSTEPIPRCYLLSPDDIGKVQLPPNSVLLVDEVGMIWDNREFKKFGNHVRDWFKLQRHYKVRCFLFSQTFDIDKKLRDLTDDMYLCQNAFRVFSYAKRINRKIILTKPTGESPARIDEELRFDSFLFFMFGSRRFTFIPKWSKYFNSFEAPKLEDKKFPKMPPIKKPKYSLFSFRRKRR